MLRPEPPCCDAGVIVARLWDVAQFCALCRKPVLLRREIPPQPLYRALAEIKSIRVHDLGPRADKIMDEFFMIVVLSIDFRIGP